MPEELPKALDKIAKDYSQRVLKHGTTAVAAGWRDLPTQKLRFDQLYKIIEQEAFTISDLGAGYGAFAEEMPQNKLDCLQKYYGYDISEEMVKAGTEKFSQDKKFEFINSSKILHETDYIIASGIFNHHFNADVTQWKTHIMDTISHMHDKAKKAIAFNMMTTYVDYQEDYIHYADPSEILSICLEHFGRNVTLNHDYDLFEFTVCIKKG